MQKHLHVISFDVPYPANYGGAIDVFYKIKNLHRAGVSIILHCFEYGRGTQSALEAYCQKVYYYKRNTSFFQHLFCTPFIVQSRVSEALMYNLLQDEYPILFEGLHTCYYLGDARLKNRKKIYRESNIEHQYYFHLAKAEKSILKKAYFFLEALKLKRFQKQLKNADEILVVSTADQAYLQRYFPNKKITYVPSFHAFDALSIKEGIGTYILYHGNLSVGENIKAVEFLIRHVFSKTKHQVLIAGLNPDKKIEGWIKKYPHIQIAANPSENEMQQLIENAQIHCLYTHQPTGLKLKLLHVLYSGRFCVCNTHLLSGTNLHEACIVKNTPEEILTSMEKIMNEPFTKKDVAQRAQYLHAFNNHLKIQQITEMLE
ncbi:MAG: glycosyltransferase family 1 protein [Bacteroidetes bacterium]|nr:glycosyltransferase family 1 protein [Bacteroidota bacterium]